MSSSFSTSQSWQLYAFGGISACCGELVSFPLDLAKTRTQLQGAAGTASTAYRSSLGAIPAILRAEGVRGLYGGLSAALLRQISYGGLRLGLYEHIKTALAAYLPATRAAPITAVSLASGAPLSSSLPPPPPPPFFVKVAAGICSGAVSATICTPLDVVKVRMQAAVASSAAAGGGRAAPGNALHALAAIARTEGVAGLWVGAVPTAQRAAVVAAAEIASYDEFKGLLISRAGLAATAPGTHVTAALLAGLICSLASSPIDVIKSRWICGHGTRYASPSDCLRQTVRQEGVRALWRGFPADFARRGPHTVTTYLVLEQLRNAFDS